MAAPSTQKFNAGVGNGFPFCLDKVDVSGYAFKEPLTLAQAMGTWWNIYSITGSASSTDWDETCDIPTLSKVPLSRVCGGSSESETTDHGSIKVSTSGVIRMYNGATSSEGNFIGYGIGSGASGRISQTHSIAFAEMQSFSGVSEAGIMSFQSVDNSGTSGSFGTITYSTVTFNGVPFIKYTRQQGSGSSTSITGLEFYETFT